MTTSTLPGRRPPAHRPPASYWSRRSGDSGGMLLAIVAGLLCFVGLMMVLSASSVEGLRSHGGPWVFFLRQLIWLSIGSAALAGAALTDYRRWRRAGGPLLVVSFALLVIVLIPSAGVSVSGSTRWLGWGPVRFQPSELAKLAVLVFAADLIARRADRVHDSSAVLKPLLVVGSALAGLILLQPDMGTASILVVIVLAVMFVGGVPMLRMTGVFTGITAGALLLSLGADYRRRRLFSFLNPWQDAANTGYQVAQSLVALGSGHVTGVGLGASRAKFGFLPNAHTDFIFAIIGEEMGLVGTVGVIALFVAFAVLGTRAALRAPDRFGSVLAAGVTAWVVVQAVINIGAVTGVLPVTGVPLPFVSFGGSSLVITLAAVGVLINVARQGRNTGRVIADQ